LTRSSRKKKSIAPGGGATKGVFKTRANWKGNRGFVKQNHQESKRPEGGTFRGVTGKKKSNKEKGQGWTVSQNISQLKWRRRAEKKKKCGHEEKKKKKKC